MLLRETIKKINETFKGLLPDLTVYGLAQSVIRTGGSEDELLPGVIGKDGEITYVGIDDVDSVRIYHRMAGITTTRSQVKGHGDDHNPIINTYQLVMIVYIDNKRSNLYPEELFLFLQANMPDEIKSPPYSKIYVRTTSVITNSQLVFRAEYGGLEIKLPPEKSLFQINYTIETEFKKGCFKECPTDC